jgi:hypothetical protein
MFPRSTGRRLTIGARRAEEWTIDSIGMAARP